MADSNDEGDQFGIEALAEELKRLDTDYTNQGEMLQELSATITATQTMVGTCNNLVTVVNDTLKAISNPEKSKSSVAAGASAEGTIGGDKSNAAKPTKTVTSASKAQAALKGLMGGPTGSYLAPRSLPKGKGAFYSSLCSATEKKKATNNKEQAYSSDSDAGGGGWINELKELKEADNRKRQAASQSISDLDDSPERKFSGTSRGRRGNSRGRGENSRGVHNNRGRGSIRGRGETNENSRRGITLDTRSRGTEPRGGVAVSVTGRGARGFASSFGGRRSLEYPVLEGLQLPASTTTSKTTTFTTTSGTANDAPRKPKPTASTTQISNADVFPHRPTTAGDRRPAAAASEDDDEEEVVDDEPQWFNPIHPKDRPLGETLFPLASGYMVEYAGGEVDMLPIETAEEYDQLLNRAKSSKICLDDGDSEGEKMVVFAAKAVQAMFTRLIVPVRQYTPLFLDDEIKGVAEYGCIDEFDLKRFVRAQPQPLRTAMMFVVNNAHVDFWSKKNQREFGGTVVTLVETIASGLRKQKPALRKLIRPAAAP